MDYRPISALESPISALGEASRALPKADSKAFPRAWMIRACLSEYLRNTIEDNSISRTTAAYAEIKRAFEALLKSDDWVHPILADYLQACQAVGLLDEPDRTETTRRIVNNGHPFNIIEWRPSDGTPIVVSNAEAHTLAIIERTVSDPNLCAGVVEAFAQRIDVLKRDLGVTHLAFIEKEAGPVGALTMMASLVKRTQLPACVYRETHWAIRSAIVGERPTKEARVAIVYDLIVSGAGVCGAADVIRDHSGARTVGAVVLCGYQERRDHLLSRAGQKIRVEALDWYEDSEATGGSVGGVGEVRKNSAPRAALLKEPPVIEKPDAIPPGTYTRATLPKASPEAMAMFERIKAAGRHAANPTNADKATAERTRLRPTESVRPGLRVSGEHKPSVGRYVDKVDAK